MKASGCLVAALLTFSVHASAQNMYLSGGYAHISGNGGLDGYNVGAEGVLNHRIALAFDYDRGFDNNALGVFALTPIGTIATHNRMQNFLVGPRFYFPHSRPGFIGRFTPFAEGQFGVTYLRESLDQPSTDRNYFANDHNFSWMLGGGVDHRFSPHFLGRVKMDLLRTHLADEGQSQFRLSLQLVYTLKSVEPQ